MKKLATAFTVIALIGAPAFAADMAVKMPLKAPPPPPVNNWTGFYFGGNVGYGWTNDLQSSIADPFEAIAFATTPLNAGGASGALGGVQVGWNWQFAPTWFVGFEGDFDFADLRKSGTVAPLFSPPPFSSVLPGSSFTASEDIHDLASIRGRIGYIWNNNWLAYFTGGGAWIDRNLSADAICPGPTCSGVGQHGPVNFRQTDWGWVLGGGLEYKAANSPWIFGVEYLYYHFEGENA